ncbi:hypothetical protein [Geodermatophilus sp. CPCC 205761]|uniref:hypothetical protein n=1 Tax=Geodermatophilus sp. CPCC 205761 TaxID=2936597 RepID=UPI003EEB586C
MSVETPAPGTVDLDAVDLSDREWWAGPPSVRYATFAALRRERPFAFYAEPVMPMLPVGPGYVAVTRYADVEAISSQPAVFCSGRGRSPSRTSRPTSTSSTGR